MKPRVALTVATRLLPIVAMIIANVSGLDAQRNARRVPLSRVITAFLVDSGVRTRGLAWTTGADLPIRWNTTQPVAVRDASSRQRGISLTRDGSFLGTLGDSVALRMNITLQGSAAGLTSMTVSLDSMMVTTPDGGGFFVHRGMIEDALKNEGLTFQPLKCSRATEGASYGNLVDAVKAPGKTASGLWWAWDSPQQQSTVSLILLYRRQDMTQVECYTG